MLSLNTLTYTHFVVGIVAALIKFPFLTLLILHVILEIFIRTNIGENLAEQILPKRLYNYILDENNNISSAIALFFGYLIGKLLKKIIKRNFRT